MKKKMVCLFFLMIGFSVFSQNRMVEKLDAQKIDCRDAALNYNVSEMVKRCEYVPLDEKAVFSIGRFFKFEVEGNYVLIQGVSEHHPGMPCILLFSGDGKFLAEIGKAGNNIGEYRQITAMAIDTLHRRILIVDENARQNLWYDFSGRYLQGTPAYPTVERLGKVYFWGKDRLLGVQNISFSKRMAYFSTDRHFSRFDTLGNHKVAWMPGVVDFGCHPLSRYGDHCLMVYPFCDTIYGYDGKEVFPRYITTVKKAVPADYRIPADADYMKLENMLKQRGYVQKTDVFETDEYVWIVYKGGDRIIYNKTTHKGFFNKRKIYEHPTIITPVDFMGQSGNALVSLLSAEELLQIKKNYAVAGVEPRGKLKALLENIRLGDNPVLIYYYFE